MTATRPLLGLLLAVAPLWGVVWLSNARVGVHPPAGAVLRLAWSALPERVETCRETAPDELARLPPHMRQRVVCEGRAASYRLTARAGGVVVADRVVRAGGLRQDRRLYVFQELRMPAAAVEIEVRFDRIESETGGPAGAPQSAGAPPAARARESIPPRLAYAGRLHLAPERVALITYDPVRRALVARGVTTPGPGR
jgi:hypothetical protein